MTEDTVEKVVNEVIEADEFAKLELIQFDDPRIHTPPAEFDFEKDGSKARRLADKLLERMFEWKGLGLSANQVGLPYKVFVMGTADTNLVVFNPTIVSVSKASTLFREGCMTYPGLYLTLRRPAECVISYQDTDGNRVVQQFPGLAARVAQHEYDHVMGIDFTQRASDFKVRWEMNKLRKAANKLSRSPHLQQRSTRATSKRG